MRVKRGEVGRPNEKGGEESRVRGHRSTKGEVSRNGTKGKEGEKKGLGVGNVIKKKQEK